MDAATNGQGTGEAAGWSRTQKLLLAVAIAAAIAVLHFARAVFIPLGLASVAVLLLWPVHGRLRRFVPQWLSIITMVLIVLLALCVLAGASWYAASAAIDALANGNGAAVDAYERVRTWATDRGLPVSWLPEVSGDAGADSPRQANPQALPGADAGPGGNAEQGQPGVPVAVVEHAVSFLTGGLSVLVWAVSVLGLAVFLMVLLFVEVPRLAERLQRELPDVHYQRVVETAIESGRQVRLHAVARTISGAIAASLTAALCWGVGVPNPLAWALLSFLLNYVPNVGVFISAAPPTLLAFATGGVGPGVAFIAGMIAIEAVLGNFIDPLIEGRALALSPFLILLSLLFWAWMWGAVGAVLCVPLTAVIIVALRNTPSTARIGRILSGDDGGAIPARR